MLCIKACILFYYLFGRCLRLDLSKADVRLVQPSATDTTEPPSSPTKAGRTARAAVARTAAQLPVHTDTAHTAKAKRITRTDAQTPVHTGIAHTANINTLTERSALTPQKGTGKRSLFSANDLPSPTTDRKPNERSSPARVRRPSSTDTINQSLQCGSVA